MILKKILSFLGFNQEKNIKKYKNLIIYCPECNKDLSLNPDQNCFNFECPYQKKVF